MDALHGATIVAAERYRLRTLTIRDNLFVIVLRGRKELHGAEHNLVVPQGSGLMIAGGTQWDVVNDPFGRGQYEGLFICFDDEMTREMAAHAACTNAAELKSARVLPADDELCEAMRRTLPPAPFKAHSPHMLRHRKIEVLLQLAEHGCRFAPVGDVGWADRVRRMVAHQPHVDWNANALASVFHVSESTLRRRIESDGTTLARLVREVRLETALALLQTTELPIGEVAHRCGWNSHSRFSAAFHERWNVAPITVRARMEETAQEMTENG